MKQHCENTGILVNCKSPLLLNQLIHFKQTLHYSHMTGVLCFTNEESYISPSYCSGNLGGKILLYDLSFGFACLLLGIVAQVREVRGL